MCWLGCYWGFLGTPPVRYFLYRCVPSCLAFFLLAFSYRHLLPCRQPEVRQMFRMWRSKYLCGVQWHPLQWSFMFHISLAFLLPSAVDRHLDGYRPFLPTLPLNSTKSSRRRLTLAATPACLWIHLFFEHPRGDHKRGYTSGHPCRRPKYEHPPLVHHPGCGCT